MSNKVIYYYVLLLLTIPLFFYNNIMIVLVKVESEMGLWKEKLRIIHRPPFGENQMPRFRMK